MPESTTPAHMSPQPVLSSSEDDWDATNSVIKPEDGYTLTALGELSPSPEETFCFAPDDIRRRNRLHLKMRDKNAQYSPQIPAGKFWNPWTSSLVSTPLTPTDFFNGFRHTLRRAYQLAQAETAEAETPSSAADLGESASTTSNSSDSYESGESVTVKDSPELIKEWRKLPLRPGIPKWDVDD